MNTNRMRPKATQAAGSARSAGPVTTTTIVSAVATPFGIAGQDSPTASSISAMWPARSA